MQLKPKEIAPFRIDDSAIRQLKVRNGESEGGWRLDLVLTNESSQKLSRLDFSIRYFTEDNSFVGLDKPSVYSPMTFHPDTAQDVALYIEPPPKAASAELRITAKSGLRTLFDDDPWWLAPAAILVGILSIIVWQQLTE